MSSRGKNLVTLALNLNLRNEIDELKNRNKKKLLTKKENRNIIDPDYDFNSESQPKKKIKVISNIILNPPSTSSVYYQVNLNETEEKLVRCDSENNLNDTVKEILNEIINNVFENSNFKPNEVNKSELADFENKTDIPVREVIDKILDKDKSQLETFTKKGEVRKRKKKVSSRIERDLLKKNTKIEQHFLRNGCDVSCKKKCLENIVQNRREEIHKQFWKLSKDDQKSFLFSCIVNISKKRKTVEGESRRKRTLRYYFTNEGGEKKEICKPFFLTTLGYKRNNDKFIRNLFSPDNFSSISVKLDGRKSNGAKKINRDTIIKHIESFGPQISHYRREHAPKRRYLPNDITIRLMYDNYKEKYPTSCFSYYLYREVVASENISFTKLGHEECWACEIFKKHNAEHTKENLDSNCEGCSKWVLHHEKYKAARLMYQRDADNQSETKITVTADLQKVSYLIMLI